MKKKANLSSARPEETNLSKVFANSDSFKPENLLADDRPKILIKESLVKPSTPPPQKPISPQEAIAPEPPETDAPLHSPHLPDDNGVQTADAPLEDDFLAPSQRVKDIPQEAQEEPAPVDIESIAEEFYNKGIQDCMHNMEEDYGSTTKALMTACEEINQVRETILNNSMKEMQDLVFAIAEKIIRFSITEQDTTIQKTVEDAIRSAVKSDEFVIQVNPDDFQTINSKSAELINSLSGLENIVFKADPTVERGGCKVESSNCTVDASIDIQLEMIKDKIKESI